MAQVSAFHTITAEADKGPDHVDVFHTNTSCPAGSVIVPWNKKFGTGGRPRCPICDELNVKKR